jgi:hypothetical protein
VGPTFSPRVAEGIVELGLIADEAWISGAPLAHATVSRQFDRATGRLFNRFLQNTCWFAFMSIRARLLFYLTDAPPRFTFGKTAGG